MLSMSRPTPKKTLKKPQKPSTSQTGNQAQVQKELMPTEIQSLNLMRNLMGTTIGAITYIRGLFPEENFVDHNVGGMALKGLGKDVDPEASTLIQLLENGVYDALDKQYLRSLTFGVYLDEDKPEELVETWSFNFTYPNQEAQMNVEHTRQGGQAVRVNPQTFTKDNIRQATVTMLRSVLSISQTLNPIPSQRYLTYHLLYYDHTPSDYEPPMFKAAENTHVKFAQQPDEPLQLGKIETPYHGVNVVLQTAMVKDLPKTQPPEIASHLRHKSLEQMIHNAPAPPLPGASIYSQAADTQALMDALDEEEPESEGGIDCVCQHDEETDFMVECTQCHTIGHGPCFGYDVKELVPKDVKCYSCRLENANNKVPGSNPADKCLKTVEVASMSLFRRYIHAMGILGKNRRVYTMADVCDLSKAPFDPLVLSKFVKYNVLEGHWNSRPTKGTNLVNGPTFKDLYKAVFSDMIHEEFMATRTLGADFMAKAANMDKPQKRGPGRPKKSPQAHGIRDSGSPELDSSPKMSVPQSKLKRFVSPDTTPVSRHVKMSVPRRRLK